MYKTEKAFFSWENHWAQVFNDLSHLQNHKKHNLNSSLTDALKRDKTAVTISFSLLDPVKLPYTYFLLGFIG